MSAECALCCLIKLKNSRYFYIIKSRFLYLTEQQTKIQLVSAVYGLTAKLSQGLNLLDADIPGIYSNGLTTATIKFSIVPRRIEGDVAQKTTPVEPDIKNKTFAGEASWQNILAVNNKLSNT
jgi:hypothetical protein